MKRFIKGKDRKDDIIVPYEQLSRKKKREQWIIAKNNCRRSPYKNFFSYEDYDFNVAFHWSDIYFLSRKYPLTYYNCTISSLCLKYNELVESKAHDIVNANPEYQDRWEELLSKGNGPLCGPKSKRFFEAWNEKEKELYDNPTTNGVVLTYGCKIDKTYAGGIGLMITVNAPVLTWEVIRQEVDKFLDNGETAWECVVPNPTKEQYEEWNNLVKYNMEGYDENGNPKQEG